LHINLKHYGLDEYFQQQANSYESWLVARVTVQHREVYNVISEYGEIEAVVSGKFAYQAEDYTDFPAVGDWVMVERVDGNYGRTVIHKVLHRRSALMRKVAGAETSGQIIAANIDTIFICMSLNADFNIRRIERYLTMAWDSMASPVIVLTKADLCNDLPEKLNQIYSVSMGVDVIFCSSENRMGYDTIYAYVEEGKTIAFVGSSGVGKSTLINYLMEQDVCKTNMIREADDKGRHTTTCRQLLLLPKGGIVIDTPGMRELQIFTGNLSKTFADMEAIAAQCRFSNCSHGTEPGCAVREAIANGSVSEKQFVSYQRLQREIAYAGLNSRQLENEKINRMFGSKGEMKRVKKQFKNKKSR